MKLKLNKRKSLFRNLILCGSLLLISNIESIAIDKNIDVIYDVSIENLGGSNNEYLYSVIETSDKKLIAVGRGNSTDGGFSNKGDYDAIIVKYDKDGSQEWVKNFGGVGFDLFNSIIETSEGDLIVVGRSNSTDSGFINKGDYDAIIVKYDKDGNQQWVKSFGGLNNEEFNSIIETSEGDLIVVGRSNSTDSGFVNKGDYDAIIVKYDKDGNQQWVKSFGGSGSEKFESVTETSDGGIVIVGNSSSSDAGFDYKGGNDAIMVKYNKDGNQEWIKSFGGSKSDCFYSIIETSDKSLVVVGSSVSKDTEFINKGNNDAIIIKYDKDGNQEWIKSFGGTNHDYFYSVIETFSKDLITVGYSLSIDAEFINKGDTDAIMIKYNKDGNQEWIKSFGGTNHDYFKSIIETDDNFVAVGYSSSIDMEFVNNGGVDAIVLKLQKESLEEKAVAKAENSLDIKDISNARDLVNQLLEGQLKIELQNRLDTIVPNLSLDRINVTSNLDLYIKSENVLMLSLDTNSVTFEDFSGVEDMVKTNAVNISINSSLPYQLNAYLPVEIQNSDKSNVMDKSILNIKENSEADYKEFANINEKVVLKDNCPAGNDLVHGVDLKLVGGIAHEKDVYKTTIKFEAEQK